MLNALSGQSTAEFFKVFIMPSPYLTETFGPSVRAERVEYFTLDAQAFPMEANIKLPVTAIAVPILVFLQTIKKKIKK